MKQRHSKAAGQARAKRKKQFIPVTATIRPTAESKLRKIAKEEHDGNFSRVARIAFDEFLERREAVAV